MSKITNTVPEYFSDVVTFRIKEVEFKPSKAGNPMLVLDMEIVAPDTYKAVDGKEYDLTTVRFPRTYIVLKSDKEDNTSLLTNIIHPKLGLPEELDAENPNTEQYVGIVFDAICSARKKVAQRLVAPGKYEDIKDANGQPRVQGVELAFDWKSSILGLSTVELNRAF